MLTTMMGQRQVLRSWRRAKVLNSLGPPLALVALALLLRLWHLGHGLPDFSEEAIPFRRALAMWGWESGHTDLNPHFFNYPSLTIYLHFFGQKVQYAIGLLSGRYTVPADFWLTIQYDPTLPVLLGRLLGMLADAASVLGAYVLAQRLRFGAGFAAALIVAASAIMLVTARFIHVDPLQAALTIWAVERLVAYQDSGRPSSLAAAVVMIGLAAGAKYNAGLLVIPLAWSIYQRMGRRSLWLWPLAAVCSLLVFLLTSPYVLLDFQTFWSDFAFERRHMTEGHLGTFGTSGASFLLRSAATQLGPLFLILLVIDLTRLPFRWRSDDGCRAVTVWLALLPALVSVAVFRMHATRYLVPLIPLAAVLVAPAALDLSDRLARWGCWGRKGRWPFGQRGAVLTILTLLLVPVILSGLKGAMAGSDTTQGQARRWFATHLAENELVFQEEYGAQLPTLFEVQGIVDNPSFAAASATTRERFLAQPRYRSVTVAMVASGRLSVAIHDEHDQLHRLVVFPHASDINQVFYHPAQLAGVDYFLKSGGVSQRYERDPERYRQQLRFYTFLDEFAEKAVSLRPEGTTSGPEITIYRLGPRVQATIARDYAYLDLYWWAAAVPMDYRHTADELLNELLAGSKDSGLESNDGGDRQTQN